MHNLFVLLGLVGIVSVLTRSYLLSPIREKVPGEKFKFAVNCPQCTGVWIGAFYAFFTTILPESITVSWFLLSFGRLMLWSGLVSLFSSLFVAILDCLAYYKSYLLSHLNVLPDITKDGDN